jgi:hypothetical protein
VAAILASEAERFFLLFDSAGSEVAQDAIRVTGQASNEPEEAMKMRNNRNAAVLVLAGALLLAAESEAGSNARHIHVNGQHMSAAQIAVLDDTYCGRTVPDGAYWVNWGTRAWGYEGGAQQGWLPSCKRQARSGGSSSTFEDRMFDGLCAQNGRCDMPIIHFPTYR